MYSTVLIFVTLWINLEGYLAKARQHDGDGWTLLEMNIPKKKKKKEALQDRPRGPARVSSGPATVGTV
jgi:hypothetical protein